MIDHKNTPISQMEDYFKNPWYHFLEEPVLFLLALKWNLFEKVLSCVKTKANSTFAINLAEMPKEATFYLMNRIFQTYVLFNYVTI